jgi:hypothetical protein
MMKRPRPSSDHIVRWIFRHGKDLLTCRVDRHARLYRLSLVPNDRENTAMVKTFASSVAALHEHAAIAAHLRAHGWTLVAYSGDGAGDALRAA